MPSTLKADRLGRTADAADAAVDLRADASDISPPRLPAILLGIGFGGFVDGIVLHQILQWHHLLTSTGDHPSGTVAGLEANTLADGLFHVVAWLFVFVGMVLLLRAWHAGRLAPPWRVQVGLLLVGWAAFNLVEGVVNHHLLNLHDVRDDVADPLWWNVGFLAASVVLLGAGLLLARRRAPASPSRVDPVAGGRR